MRVLHPTTALIGRAVQMGAEGPWGEEAVLRGLTEGTSQLLQISDPWLMAEFLDRNKYPELVDKPQEPMFYRSFDEVLPSPVSLLSDWMGCLRPSSPRSFILA